MKIRIRMFAVARQLAGQEAIELEVPPECTVLQLRQRLAAAVPALAPVLPSILFAIGSEYAQDDWPIPENIEVACIPPVSGG